MTTCNPSILIVEDDNFQLQRYCRIASRDYQVFQANDLNTAIKLLDEERIDILLTDIHLNNTLEFKGYEGFQILDYVKANHRHILAIVMSSDPNVEIYHTAFKKGALHYLKKPIISADEILIAIQNASERKNLTSAHQKNLTALGLPENLAKLCPDGLVLNKKLRKLVRQVGKSRKLSLIITGETGTGKEEIAHLVHKHREMDEGPIPFVAVNCANLDDNIAASLLFGHRKGAFTGAESSTNGYIGEANGGILFLDEIHRLPISCQQRLLRVLNDGTYQRLGESKTLRSEFQIVVASTEDLDEMVTEGKLIPDLRYRVAGVEIHLAPLRDRLQDIDLLVPLFFAKEKIVVDEVELHKIIERCKTCLWPGNIRQLIKALSTLATMSFLNEEPVKAENLPMKSSMSPICQPKQPQKEAVSQALDQELIQKILAPMEQDQSLKESVEFYESLIITRAIERHRSISDVVNALETNRSSLDLKRKKYNLLQNSN